jgi:hypothetical protein
LNAALAAAAALSLFCWLMGHLMRIALCVVAVLLGFVCLGHAQDTKQKINPRWKTIEIPLIDPNAGITARFGANESQIWQTPDPSSVSQARRSWNEDDRSFGLTVSRPFQY